MSRQRIHFISIGGAVMHNLAMELAAHGHQVTGSDDEIYNPSRDRLAAVGLLPDEMGWNADRISEDIDVILLGMHARPDNPELLRAQELGLSIHSFPSYIGSMAQDKMQIVVAGSHGKTTTTSMIMHVMREAGWDFDYLVGAQIEGFDRMVRLSDAPIIVIEGDEYLSSPIDRRPKIAHYRPDLLVMTGIRWDHMNVFPTEQDYIDTFAQFIKDTPRAVELYYDRTDDILVDVVGGHGAGRKCIGYEHMPYVVEAGRCAIGREGRTVRVMGRHNMKNMAAAFHITQRLGLSTAQIMSGLASFSGAAKRQNYLLDLPHIKLIRDFAHAPSKVGATTRAFRELYPHHRLVACVELHTYSSLNAVFLPQYADTCAAADDVIVSYSEQTLKIKRMPALDPQSIRLAFRRADAHICTDAGMVQQRLQDLSVSTPIVILMMSSGTFGGLDLEDLVAYMSGLTIN